LDGDSLGSEVSLLPCGSGGSLRRRDGVFVKSLIGMLVAGVMLPVCAVPVCASSTYPERPIHLLFGFPPGNDLSVRVIADRLAEGLGQPVIVENITGAGGHVAADRVSAAVPDGHTIGVLSGANIVLRPLLHRRLAYDPRKFLVPVSLLFRFPTVLVVNNELGVRTMDDLVKHARSAPGSLSYGHLGIGSVTHMTAELFKMMAKVDIEGVPYRGATAILTDLIAGRIAMSFIPPPTALPLIEQGKIRALALASKERAPFAPELPTVSESGYPGFAADVWFGLFVPAGTPQPIVDRLSQECERIMVLPDVRERLKVSGHKPVGSTRADFEAAIERDFVLWRELIKAADIKFVD
jgi:tripartite-type tricarboxylate transporter receptor subunit TctC